LARVGGFERAVTPIRPGRRINISTNMGQAIAGTLYYELAVAEKALSSKEMRKFSAEVYEFAKDDFGQFVDARALTNPKALHHVYEWNAIGSNRLWRLKKNNKGNGFVAGYSFILSKRKAPIHPDLKVPGPNGRKVTKSQIFKQKAAVMELGIPVTMRRRSPGGRYMAFIARSFRGHTNKRGIAFSTGPIRVNLPGGIMTKGGFAKVFNSYFGGRMFTERLNKSGVINKPVRRIEKSSSVPAHIANPHPKSKPTRSAIEGAVRLRG